MNKGRKDFFFEKKKQKTFAHGVRPIGSNPLAARHPNKAKVFWFFFSKKNNLPSGHQRYDKRFFMYQTNNSNPGRCQAKKRHDFLQTGLPNRIERNWLAGFRPTRIRGMVTPAAQMCAPFPGERT